MAFSEVAPVALMLGSPELLRAWGLATLAGLADDDHHAWLRETLLVFLAGLVHAAARSCSVVCDR